MTHEIKKNVESIRVTVPASTTVNNGDIVSLDGFIGVADLAAIGTAQLVTPAGVTRDIPIDIAKNKIRRTDQFDTAGTYNKGALVYWDAANRRLTATVGSNALVGKVVARDGTWLEFMFV